MRMMNAPPMNDTQFEDLLALAKTGGIQSDTGASTDLDNALTAIARSAPNAPAALIAAARAAYAAQPK